MTKEGYFLLDHRESPGMPEGAAVSLGLDPELCGPGKIFESAVYACSHCQKQVFRRPGRTRERGYCPKCDHPICDSCEVVRVLSGVCRPYKQVMDEALEAAIKKEIVHG